MVSALSPAPTTPLLATGPESPASWPHSRRGRWLARALFALPFVALAVVTRVVDAPTPVNAALVRAGDAVRWGSGDFAWIRDAYPPIPTGIAGALPGGTFMLALVGAVAAGLIVHSLAERLVQRGTPTWLTVLLLASLLGTPLFGYMATTSLSEFLGFSLVVVAMAGFLRFAVFGDTDGGFQAGLLLGLAAACDASTLLYALMMGIAAPFIAHRRFRGAPEVGRASAAVIAFPALMAMAGWAFLEWRFAGSFVGSISDGLSASELTWSSLLDTTLLLGWVALRMPLFVVCGVLLFLRRRPALIGYLLPFPALVLSLWLGLRTPSGATVLLFTALALLAVPAHPSRPIAILLGAAALAQVAVVWLVLAPLSAPVTAWLDVMLGR